MELTKEQILYIDHRLENEGVKYWDIRIEMLNHVVSDVETKLELETSENDFKEIVQNTFVGLGWKKNFNGGGLDKVYRQRLKDYSRKNNKGIIKEFKERFLDFKTITAIFLFFLYLFTFKNNAEVIKYTIYLAFAFSVIALLSFTLKYKVLNSARLVSSLAFATFPLSLVNCFIFFPKVFFGYEELSSSYTTAVYGISIPFLAIGINYLFKEFKSVQKIYNKLIE
jgi:hypothetical protein